MTSSNKSQAKKKRKEKQIFRNTFNQRLAFMLSHTGPTKYKALFYQIHTLLVTSKKLSKYL